MDITYKSTTAITSLRSVRLGEDRSISVSIVVGSFSKMLSIGIIRRLGIWH
nr:hypothetical protein [Sulfolobus acidocaldarius]